VLDKLVDNNLFFYYNMEGELMMDDKIRDNRQV
jgi:hypothetical protein